MKTSLRQLDEKRAATIVRRVTPIDFRGVWAALRPAVEAQGLVGEDALFAAVFKVPTLRAGLAMEWYAAALILDEGQTPRAPLEELIIPGGAYVTCTYQGPFEGLGQAWEKLTEHLERSAHVVDLRRPCFELYLDDTSATEPDENRVALYVPVKVDVV